MVDMPVRPETIPQKNLTPERELPDKAGYQLWFMFGAEDVEFSTGRAQHRAASSAE